MIMHKVNGDFLVSVLTVVACKSTPYYVWSSWRVHHIMFGIHFIPVPVSCNERNVLGGAVCKDYLTWLSCKMILREVVCKMILREVAFATYFIDWKKPSLPAEINLLYRLKATFFTDWKCPINIKKGSTLYPCASIRKVRNYLC